MSKIYYKDLERKIIKSGCYKKHNFWIITNGAYPCAYVELLKKDKFYNKTVKGKYDKIPIDVHGGLTYAQTYLQMCVTHSAVIGWDYAHPNDYIYYPDRIFLFFCGDEFGKKWTIKEIMTDIKSVINQTLEKKNVSAK